MRQFTLKRLLGSLVLVSLGFLAVGTLWRESRIPGAVLLPVIFFPVWFGGGALIGAGVFTPFRLWWAGVAISIPIQFVLLGYVFQNL